MSFWRQVPRQAVKALFSRTLFSWVARTEMQKQMNGQRVTLYRLAISELSLARTIFFLFLLGLVLLAGANLSLDFQKWVGDGPVLFLLSDNSLHGVLLGYLFGLSSVLLFRRIWVTLVFSLCLMAAGILALNVGWGVWMGLLPGFWFLQVSCYHDTDIEFKKWLVWKAILSLMIFPIVFIFSNSLSDFLRSQFASSTFLEARIYQWFLSGCITLLIGLGLSAIFFHIYFWHFGQKR